MTFVECNAYVLPMIQYYSFFPKGPLIKFKYPHVCIMIKYLAFLEFSRSCLSNTQVFAKSGRKVGILDLHKIGVWSILITVKKKFNVKSKL